MNSLNAMLAAISILLGAWCAPVLAQTYPARPVTVIVPYQAGGGLDMMCRVVSERLAEYLKQPVLVENRAGAGGTIGAAVVAQAAPDGYTILCCSNSESTLAQYVMAKLAYDPERDLVPITLAVAQTVVLVAHPSLPVSGLKQLLELTRKKPLSYAHPGVGNSIHLAMEMLGTEGQAPFIHVPYKGAAGLVTDVLAGHVPLAIINLAPLVQYIQDKRLKPLAVFQSERNPHIPEVPTVKEVIGIDIPASSWFGFFGPAKAPMEFRSRLDQEIRRALAEPGVRSKLGQVHMQVIAMPAHEFAEFVKRERALNAAMVKRHNIKVE